MSSYPAPTEKPRLLQLDLLRGIAILLVLGRHAPLPWNEAGVFKPFAGLWMRLGWTGVDLFFVLSGFLVGGLLFKELRTRSQLDARRFIIRRGFKIWPSYYLNVMVGFVVILALTGGDLARAVHAILPNLLHLQNYFYTPASPAWRVLGPTWSLAIEEHFYLALPLLLLLLTARKRAKITALPAIPVICIGLMVFCGGLRWWLMRQHPPELATFGLQTHLRIDSLFLGVCLAYLYHFKPALFAEAGAQRNRLLILSLLFLSPAMLLERSRAPFLLTFGFALLAIGYALLLIAVVTTPIGDGRLGKLMDTPLARGIAWIGFYSYTIYLWHILFGVMPIEAMVAHGIPIANPTLRWLSVIACYLTLAIAGGAIMGFLVDRPMLARRDRLFPGRAVAVSPQIIHESVTAYAAVTAPFSPLDRNSEAMPLSSATPLAESALSAQTERPAPSSKRLHLVYLDGVRAVAAIYVVIFHAWAMVWGFERMPTGLNRLLTSWTSYGHWSVCIFIVLSGFCLMLPVVRDGKLRYGFREYITRRARRILTPYYFALGVSLLLIATLIGQKTGTAWDRSLPVTPMGVLSHLLVIHDLYKVSGPGDWYSQINYPFWSVAVEWHIYFAFPLLVLLWRRYGAWKATAIGVFASYALVIALHKTPLIGLTPQFLSLFVFGMLGATISFGTEERWSRLRDRFPWGLFTLVTALVVAVLVRQELQYGRVLDFFVGLATLGALISMSRPGPNALRRFFSLRPIVFVGTFSYSIYLMHAPILQLLWQYVLHPLGLNDLPMFFALELIGLPLVIAASYLFFLGCERPYLSSAKQSAAKPNAPLPFPAREGGSESQA